MAGSFAGWLALWAALAAAVIVVQWRRGTAGLMGAYVGALGLYYWAPVLIYLLPWYVPVNNPTVVLLGVQQSTYAMVGLAIGALVVTPLLFPVRSSAQEVGRAPARPALEHRRLAIAYVLLGVLAYAGVNTILRRVPTGTALASVGDQLVVVGLCIGCWQAWKSGRRSRLTWWLAAAALLPFVTTVVQGFLGFGAIAGLIVLAFTVHLGRPRWRTLLSVLAVGYLALSLFVTYFGARSAIREVVWAGRPLSARLTAVGTSLVHFDWFNPANQTELAFVDARLDQAAQVGAAVSYLSGTHDFAHGRTIQQAVEALVPRILWPSKPVQAGSGDLVSHYTGIQFAPGTAIGIGPVMELYVNFGSLGVVVGFALFGVAVAALDLRGAERLRSDDAPGFALLFLVGLSFLDVVGGSLVDLTSSAGASLVVGLAVSRFVLPDADPPEALALRPAGW